MMDYNGKRKQPEGGTKFDSDEDGPIVYPTSGHAMYSPSVPLPDCEPSVPAKLVVHWTVLTGGVLFFVSCLMMVFVVWPSIRGIYDGLRAEREAMQRLQEGRTKFDLTTRDAQAWIVKQQAEQIQQIQQFKQLVEALRSTLNRKD